MGLDMRPLGKPKKGFEKRFDQIMRIIKGEEKEELSFFDKLKGRKVKTKDELLKEWFANQVQSYETLKAPQIGRDKKANDWMLNKYKESNQEISLEDMIKKHKGYYVIELAEKVVGVPVYASFGQDANVFRGKFLEDCFDLFDQNLLGEAWETKTASEALDFGKKLMHSADQVASKYNLQNLKTERMPPKGDKTGVAGKIHIVYSLANWLIFYGENGHGYEADF